MSCLLAQSQVCMMKMASVVLRMSVQGIAIVGLRFLRLPMNWSLST